MKIFSGAVLFELKATHGISFDITLSTLVNKGYTINWIEFIECSRKNKWYDFQTIESIEHALQDVYNKEEVYQIIQRMKLYILNTI